MSCSDGRVLHNVVNNISLCNGITEKGKICGTYDEKAFYTTKSYKCKKLKFESTGVESTGGYYLVLAGVELFGSLSRKIYSKISCKTKHGISMHYLTVALLLFIS